MSVGEVGDDGLTTSHRDTANTSTSVREDVVVSKLHSLGVTSGTRGVAENVDIIFLRGLKGRSFAIFTSLDDVVVRVEGHTNFSSGCLVAVAGCRGDDKGGDVGSLSRFFHGKDLIGVVRGDNDGSHFGLVKDELDLHS